MDSTQSSGRIGSFRPFRRRTAAQPQDAKAQRIRPRRRGESIYSWMNSPGWAWRMLYRG